MEERKRRYVKVIVGLGNPGQKYENTRHNIGFAVLDKLGGGKFKFQKYLQAEVLRMGDVVLVKPQTFMNKSGMAVKKLIENYKLEIENLYVVHDDLDIKLGEYKIQLGKGPKVHNGVNSVEESLGSDQFWRVRMGIDNRNQESGIPSTSWYGASRNQGEEYVLGRFLPEEEEIISRVIQEVTEKL